MAWRLPGTVGTNASRWYAYNTLSARTMKRPKSSSTAHCVTILRCRTRRRAANILGMSNQKRNRSRAYILSHIGTQSKRLQHIRSLQVLFHPASLSHIPSVTQRNHYKKHRAQKKLTKRHRTRNLPSKKSTIVQNRSIQARIHTRHQKCIHTQTFNREHPVHLLNNLSQPQRFLQFLLPLVTYRAALGIDGVRTT